MVIWRFCRLEVSFQLSCNGFVDLARVCGRVAKPSTMEGRDALPLPLLPACPTERLVVLPLLFGEDGHQIREDYLAEIGRPAAGGSARRC